MLIPGKLYVELLAGCWLGFRSILAFLIGGVVCREGGLESGGQANDTFNIPELSFDRKEE